MIIKCPFDRKTETLISVRKAFDLTGTDLFDVMVIW
jgi:hypothetical protein